MAGVLRTTGGGGGGGGGGDQQLAAHVAGEPDLLLPDLAGEPDLLLPDLARGLVAKHVRSTPFKGLPVFYDVAPLLRVPFALNVAMAFWAQTWRARGTAVDVVAGIDARGLVFGPLLALRLGLPFEMVRKAGKLPLATESDPYVKEYAEEHGADKLCVQTDLLKSKVRVLLVDDIVATGGTMVAAVALLRKVGCEVVACGCLVHMPELGAQDRLDVPIVSVLVSADLA
jgi:adenine phosphoribosyltransferase